ncbi:MAG: hypothetical protein ABI898_08595 [Sphingomonadales bacterium]
MTAPLLTTIYASYAALAAFAFVFLKPRDAVFATYFAGWLLLPVGVYPPVVNSNWLPIEIIGLTLPSQMLVTKAAVVPLVAAAYSLIFDWRRWRAMRPAALDVFVIAFCLWPLVQGQYLSNEFPLSDDSAWYFASTWGLSWWLGRLYFKASDDRDAFLRALMIAGLVLIPAAIIEGVHGPLFYHSLYGRAPYEFVGADRYFGFRPSLLFEDGNQYGIWMAMAALAAFMRAGPDSRSWLFAGILVATSVASQSAGAVALLAVGVVLLTVRVSVPRWLWQIAIVGLGIVAVGLMTGLLPVNKVAAIGGIGQHVADAMRAAGRGSLPWRVTQELRVLPIIREHFVMGYGTWFWWHSAGTRPWGFPLMMIGQYGLIGFVLIFLPIVFGPLRTVLNHARLPLAGPAALGLIVLLAGADAMLNNFIFFPAILISGGLATARRQAATDFVKKSGFARLGDYLSRRSIRSMQRQD